ncbi:MAG: rRNA pseudouridine synthase [Spongiibacteraceae bacterium]
MTEPLRLSKRLIELTHCSRREAELYIEGGWVLVDGDIVEEPQFKVEQQRIELLPNAVAAPLEPVTLLLNVPANESIAATLAALDHANRWPDDGSGVRPLKRHLLRLTLCLPLPAGASGLQVLTQDKRVERKLTDDANRLEQEYVVEVSGDMVADGLKLLNGGFVYKGVEQPPMKVSWQNETRLRFALRNPPSGLIETMCQGVGLKVVSMKRIRIGGVPMSKPQPGQWRYLATKESF